ncbi:related to tetrahydrofolylpolyglutamate synthase [Phialocephala subalpina]|uniref:tetrahydrofolate synthase n=1 Tax=Phialocephala subalpina TaxID=576137 RepID=A0A1L7XUQ7_9HELO|nr:related to tetrahydrofolylpolyglutamate synthase [Phialocephala subalpina]
MKEDQEMPLLDRSYKRAVELTKARIREQRSNVPGKPTPGVRPMPRLNGEAQLTGVPSIYGMKEWLGELGHSAEDINRLNVIHVAGTKGKGSTCAFIESFLRAHGKRTGFPRKTGLYTSPHLIVPEERIRINFQPLSRALFAKYFFEVEDILSKGEGRRPRFLQLYFIFALHAFIREGVDAAIIETHHGGEYDSTNVVEKPVVTCVTTLGLDHVQQLGSSLESIAWHKAGIFKPGARAVSAPAVPEATAMLENRALEKGASLEFADNNPVLPEGVAQIEPAVLRTNCSVAISGARAFIEATAGEKPSSLSDSDITEGIKQWSWPGRFQTEHDGPNTWYLDGAHNDISLTAASAWFLSHTTSSPLPKILIFAQITKVREGGPVVECLARALAGNIKHVIFTTYRKDQDAVVGRSEKQFDVVGINKAYAEVWKKVQPDAEVSVEGTIEGALEKAREIGKESGGMQTLITGSQHLVGPALALIRPQPADHLDT